jgi:hypothetical protein
MQYACLGSFMFFPLAVMLPVLIIGDKTDEAKAPKAISYLLLASVVTTWLLLGLLAREHL